MTIESQGVFSMSTTPFKESGDLDEAAFRRHLHFQADGGVGVYVLSYGSGEGHQVNQAEMLRIYEISAKELKGKVPVYAAGQGLGPSTKDFVALAKDIAATGIDAIQLHSPRPAYPAAPAKPAEIERYFQDVLEAVDYPFILSVHQGAVPGVEPRVEFLKQLTDDYKHLLGFNISHPNLTYMMRLVDAVGKTHSVRVGGSAQALASLALGSHGFLCYETNICPNYCRALYDDYQAGNANKAGDAYQVLQRMFLVLNKYRNPQSIKAAMNGLGLPGGNVRRPYLELDEAAHKDIMQVMTDLKIKELEGLP